jgi:hypothetical protein
MISASLPLPIKLSQIVKLRGPMSSWLKSLDHPQARPRFRLFFTCRRVYTLANHSLVRVPRDQQPSDDRWVVFRYRDAAYCLASRRVCRILLFPSSRTSDGSIRDRLQVGCDSSLFVFLEVSHYRSLF